MLALNLIVVFDSARLFATQANRVKFLNTDVDETMAGTIE